MYDLLARKDISSEAKLRVAILYALRYQKYSGNHITNVVKTLLDGGVEESRAGVSASAGGKKVIMSDILTEVDSSIFPHPCILTFSYPLSIYALSHSPYTKLPPIRS